MGKEQQGIVIETSGNIAKVKSARHGECENCGACPGDLALILEASNDICAKKGDKVVLELREKGMVQATFVVYMMPLIMSTVGAVSGGVISRFIGWGYRTFQIVGGISGLIISVFFMIKFEKVSRGNFNKMARITKILE